MSTTDEQYIQQIVTDLGDESGLVEANVRLFWQMYEGYIARPHLRYLHTERRAVIMLLGNNREQAELPPGGDGDSESDLEAESNRARELRTLLMALDTELKMFSGSKRARAAASGVLRATSPYSAATGAVDPVDMLDMGGQGPWPYSHTRPPLG